MIFGKLSIAAGTRQVINLNAWMWEAAKSVRRALALTTGRCGFKVFLSYSLAV